MMRCLLFLITVALFGTTAEAELDDNAQQKARTAGEEAVRLRDTQRGEFWESKAKAAGLITDEDIQEFLNIAQSEYERSRNRMGDTAHAGIAPISWQNWNIALTDFRVTETVDMENMWEKNPVAEEGNITVATRSVSQPSRQIRLSCGWWLS